MLLRFIAVPESCSEFQSSYLSLAHIRSWRMAFVADDFLTVRRINVSPILIFNFKGSVKEFISPFACIGEEVGVLTTIF